MLGFERAWRESSFVSILALAAMLASGCGETTKSQASSGPNPTDTPAASGGAGGEDDGSSLDVPQGGLGDGGNPDQGGSAGGASLGGTSPSLGGSTTNPVPCPCSRRPGANNSARCPRGVGESV